MTASAAVFSSSGSSPPDSSPLQTLLASGQAIQVTEVDISNGNVPPAKQPALPAEPTYTLSMDVFIEKVKAGGARNLIENTTISPEWLGNPATGPNQGITRRPMVYVNGDGSWAPQNAICAEHFDRTNHQQAACTPAAPVGTYFNFIMTVDNAVKKITTYINGVEKSNHVSTDYFTWSARNNWVLGNPSFFQTAADGALKVKNVYLFPKVLSSTEMGLLQQSTGTTSTYIVQPESPSIAPFGKSGYMTSY
jgi:hypothetical protein